MIEALWTFPAIIIAALIIAWAAECGQFYISQGLALAVLAWVQTLPEFAVEAAIALEAAKDPEKVHLMTANFTGSLRLFVGLGWPMVYFVAFAFSKTKKVWDREFGFWEIVMEDEQSIAVISLLPTLFYFSIIYLKGSLTWVDGVILACIYFGYLWLLSKMPPQESEGVSDLGFVPRWVMSRPRAQSLTAIGVLFVIGAMILWFCAHPFLDSMLAIAVTVGMSQFVFVQWVAPFLSEFPEKLSAFHWAKTVKKAPMALSNFVSSSINQWTILVATVPFIYAFGLGQLNGGFMHFQPIIFDEHQKTEVLLTIVQSYLGFVFLASLTFAFPEALGLFVLWIIQFFVPDVREEIIWVYGGWAAIETVRMIIHYKKKNAFHVFKALVQSHLFKRA